MKSKLYFIVNFIIDNCLAIGALFVGLNNKNIIFNSTHNTNYNFNSKYLFEYMTKNAEFSTNYVDKLAELNCFFVINDDIKRKQLLSNDLTNIISTKSIRNKWLCLTAKVWVCSTIETPIFTIFKNKNRIVYHLGHGIPLKNIGLAEANISYLQFINRYLRVRLFSHVTCFSDYFELIMAKTFGYSSLNAPQIIVNKFNLLSFGQPRNDSLSQDAEVYRTKEKLLNSFSNQQLEISARVLYCPTWRDYAITKFFPFADMDIAKLNDYLENTKTVLYIREHPYYKADIDNKIFDLPRVVNLDTKKVADINSCLSCFNQLITDYSSIFIDFMALNRRVVFVPYDFDLYQQKVGFTKPYAEIAIGDKVNSLAELIGALTEKNDVYQENRAVVCKKLNVKITGNCQEHANYLMNMLFNKHNQITK